MSNVFKKILFLLVTLFFTLSALEVNACGIENTFFDEYDTYIESKEQTVLLSSIIQNKDDDNKNNLNYSYHHFLCRTVAYRALQFILTDKVDVFSTTHDLSLSLPKLYLLYSVWII